MNKYKWSHPSEWLQEKIQNAGHTDLVSLADALATMLDGDQIQDAFESDMDDDGYFVDLDKVSEDSDEE